MNSEITGLRERFESQLGRLFERPEVKIEQAMAYSVLNGGKRLRPLLTYLVGLASGANLEQLDASAVAVELIHCYSLVHDDLPAMDNDDLRRGKPTCHIQFDEATAILVGDALQTLAFECLASDVQDPISQIRQIRILSQASGYQGMCLGQSLDMENQGQTGLDILQKIHACKTGRLITACFQMAAIAAGHFEDDEYIKLTQLGQMLGQGFQIRDDILDRESTTEVLGKPQGSDIKNNKLTYLTHFSLDDLKGMLEKIETDTQAIIETLPYVSTSLKMLASYLVKRDH